MAGKRRAFAIVANVGAAVAAVLAFGVWQRFQAPRHPADVHEGFYQLADDVGFIARANRQWPFHPEAEGRKVFAATYTIGPDHFRVVPAAIDNPDACVLVFGDSFSFGYGVSDDETFAAQIVKRSGRRVAVHNLAGSGWGPHQFLAALQSGRFQKAIKCEPTDAVFLMIPSLIWRANGVGNTWDANGPRYRLADDGRPVRDGALGGPDPYNWRRWIGIQPVGKGEAMKLALAVIVEAANELKRVYHGISMHFISYRVSSWSDVGLSADDMLGFEYRLQQAGITPLPLEAVIPRYRFAMADYILDPTDHHPNARAHRLIAEFILRQINED